MKYSAEIYIISKEKEMDNQYSKWEYDNPIGDWRSATYLYKDYDGIYMNLDYKDDYIHVYTYHAEKGAIGKLIIVPDNTEYSDLSFYLDQVLEMEKEQLKVLNKTL